jgi:hypothetical protein
VGNARGVSQAGEAYVFSRAYKGTNPLCPTEGVSKILPRILKLKISCITNILQYVSKAIS